MSNKNWTVISPDGFAIHHSDTYPSRDAAKTAFNEWVKRFEPQGYYSSNRGRIPLDELEAHCRFVEMDNDETVFEAEINNLKYGKQ